MKSFFSLVPALFLLAVLLSSCSQHLAPVGSGSDSGKTGVIILHDEPKPEDEPDETPQEESQEPPEQNPDTANAEDNETTPDDPDPAEPHSHKYGSWIKKVPPTCTVAGIKGHYHCSRCGKDFDSNKNEISDLVIPPAGHTEGEWIIEQPATCTESGSKHRVCAICGEATLTEEIPATGHRVVTDIAVAPTCTEDGLSEGKHCSVCGMVFAEQAVIPATGHAETIDKAVAPTCTENGLSEGKHCSICGIILLAQTAAPKTGHAFGEWIEEIPATCFLEGTSGHFVCSNCNGCFDDDEFEITDLTIPRKTHRYKNGTCIYCGERTPSEYLDYQSVGTGVCVLLSYGICPDSEIVVPSFAPSGERVIGIAQNAFFHSSCQKVYLPVTITQISSLAFQNCSNLTEIVFSGTIEEWNAIEKDNHWKIGETITIQCLDGSFEV